jgi:hypothetical protein
MLIAVFDGQVSRACAFVEGLVGSQSIVGAADRLTLMVGCRVDSSARHSSFYRHAWIAIAKVGQPGIYL